MNFLKKFFSNSLPKNVSSLPLTKNLQIPTKSTDSFNEESSLHDKFIPITQISNPNFHDPEQYKDLDSFATNGNVVKTIDYLDKLNGNSVDTDKVDLHKEPKTETIFWVALQIIFPYIIAGFGMVAAGVVLDKVQHWTVFESVTELYILIPPLLGLKGNLEMTLASRISTQANLGHVDTSKEYLRMARGNLSLLQIQAICLGFYASVIALLIGFIPDGGRINILHAQILLASCLLTTTIASAILGVIMITVVYYTRKYHVNPDNIATPIAASFGDLITMGVLALISRFLFQYANIYSWLCIPIIVIYLLIIPIWFVVCRRNHFVRKVLTTGWSPIIASMTISSIGGLILDYTVRSFNGIAVYQPIINGIGGNLVAIQASRLSTDFHKLGPPGTPFHQNRHHQTSSNLPLHQNGTIASKTIPSNTNHYGATSLDGKDSDYKPRTHKIDNNSINVRHFTNQALSRGDEKTDSPRDTDYGIEIMTNISSTSSSASSVATHNSSNLKTDKPDQVLPVVEISDIDKIEKIPQMRPATYNIYKTFCSSAFNSRMVRLLIYFALPGHVFFMFLISYIKNGRSTITPFFGLFYMASAMIQVLVLLYLANVLILLMWRRKTDPDNAAIPYLTAIGDFLGIGLLSLSFFMLYRINPKDPNLDAG